jgi:hypothetical protein
VTTTATTEPVTAFLVVSLTGSKAATSALRPFSFAAPSPGISRHRSFIRAFLRKRPAVHGLLIFVPPLMHRPDMPHRCLIRIGLSASRLDRSGEVAMRDRVGRL